MKRAAPFLILVACGGASEHPEPKPPPLPVLPQVTAEPPPSSAPAVMAAASAEPGPPDVVPRIARSMFPADLDPARARVGWLPTTQAFVYATGVRDGTKRSSLTLVVASEDAAAKRSVEVCDAGACATDAGRAKLEQVIREGGLVDMMVLEPILFPFPPKEVTVGAIAAQVRWVRDHLEIVRKARPERLAPIEAADRATAMPVSVTASPDGAKLLLSYSVGKQPDPNAAMKSVVYALTPATK